MTVTATVNTGPEPSATPAYSRRHVPPVHRTRLRLKPKGAEKGQVDGAWWPRATDLAAEVPALLAVLSVRLGPIHRVSFHLGDWGPAPPKLPTGGQLIPLDGFHFQAAHTLAVSGINRQRLVLLVVPPSTLKPLAHTAMMMAAGPDDHTTAAKLFQALLARPGEADGYEAAEQRWDSEGGAVQLTLVHSGRSSHGN